MAVTVPHALCRSLTQRMPEWGGLWVPQLTGDIRNMLAQNQAISTSFQDRIQDMMIVMLHLLRYSLLHNQNLKASLCVKMQYGTLISMKVKT